VVDFSILKHTLLRMTKKRLDREDRERKELERARQEAQPRVVEVASIIRAIEFLRGMPSQQVYGIKV
jgi:hypothetical protein